MLFYYFNLKAVLFINSVISFYLPPNTAGCYIAQSSPSVSSHPFWSLFFFLPFAKTIITIHLIPLPYTMHAENYKAASLMNTSGDLLVYQRSS